MTITTYSGQQFEALLFSELPRLGWAEIRLTGTTIAEAAAVFGDPTETQIITGGGTTVTGYTLNAIRVERGYIRVDLVKGG